MSSQSGVYIKDEKLGWLPANVISYEGDHVKVTVMKGDIASERDEHYATSNEERIVKLEQYDDGMLPLQNIDDNGNFIVVPDMCELPSLHEASILYNLKARHETLKPYTRVGDIIIAMNPFHWIRGIYSPEIRELYVDKIIRSVDTNSKENLDPHVYEISSLAYRGLALESQHQSILVSGESGAGKTETVKIVMSHLASVQNNDTINTDDKMNDNMVVRRVLDSNPLLEAFGNAKTVRNDNSSRFGKYIQLQFDVEDAANAAFSGKSLPSCFLAGSTCETYLLEKSRVVNHEYTERTYHIFYQLLAAPDTIKSQIWSGLVGKSYSSFKYIGETDTVSIENKTDAEKWQITVDALSLLGINGEIFKDLMRAICITMQLGNLTFTVDPSNDDGTVISSKDELNLLSELMGVEVTVIERALTFRTIYAPKETYSVPLRVGAANDSRDALAKETYQQAFNWLVAYINDATCAENNYDEASNVEDYGNIGLLDIFGFESFNINRFEQFCINYANEKLQSKYNLDIFSSVQDEYNYEGIAMPEISFTDNSDVVNLIEGRMGLISMLNEECLRPHGNDSSFVSKMKKVNQDFDALVQNPLHTPTEFSIVHYAAEVVYEAANFVQKNTDKLAKDLIDCTRQSTNSLLKDTLERNDKHSMNAKGRGNGSVSSKFRSQLTSLMTNISSTKTHYIRCIKPNPEKIPTKVDMYSCLEQLRCAGVVAAVTISRASYPNRLTHESCIARFSCLRNPDGDGPDGDGSKQVVTKMVESLLHDRNSKSNDGESSSAFETGVSRIYFKAGTLEYLESERLKKLEQLATVIQQIFRGFNAFSHFSRLKDTTIGLQALVRRNMARKKLLDTCSAVTSISCWIRCLFAKVELLRRRQMKACTFIQTRFRMHVAKKFLARSVAAVICMQKICRGALQRPLYLIMLEEAREEARVNSKLAALQKRLADAEMKWILADKARVEAEKRSKVEGEEKKLEEIKEEGGKSEDQKALLDESTKMLEYLKKQVFEFRSKNFLMRNDLSQLKFAHNHLVDQYSALTSSYEALKQQSTSLSLSNKKIISRANDGKKSLFDTKKELKASLFQHKAEMRKLTDLMRAKEKDSAETISYLQAELASLTTLKGNTYRERQGKPRPALINTSSFSKKQEPKKKSPKHSVIKNNNVKKKRANFRRKTPTSVSPPQSFDDDEWVHDKHIAANRSTSRSSPTNSTNSATARKKINSNNNKVQTKRPSKKNANSGFDSKVMKQKNTQMDHNNSYKTNSKKNIEPNVKKSSLAVAAIKKSSLASRVNSPTN